eukprot:40207_1
MHTTNNRLARFSNFSAADLGIRLYDTRIFTDLYLTASSMSFVYGWIIKALSLAAVGTVDSRSTPVGIGSRICRNPHHNSLNMNQSIVCHTNNLNILKTKVK